jgi:hypothetical protein
VAKFAGTVGYLPFLVCFSLIATLAIEDWNRPKLLDREMVLEGWLAPWVFYEVSVPINFFISSYSFWVISPFAKRLSNISNADSADSPSDRFVMSRDSESHICLFCHMQQMPPRLIMEMHITTNSTINMSGKIHKKPGPCIPHPGQEYVWGGSGTAANDDGTVIRASSTG